MRALPAFLVLICAFAPAFGQRKVDPRNTYQRVIAIVPMTGSGTAADPRRPLYAPLPPTKEQAVAAAKTRTGILAFTYQLTDDGKSAIVELVARDRSAFAPILADRSANVKVFEKDKMSRQQLETEVKKQKRDFDFTRFGVVLP